MGLVGLRSHWRTASWWIAWCGFLGLAVLTWQPAAAILAKPLVGRYPIEVRPAGDAEAIVVLGGGMDQATIERPYDLVGRDTYRRVMHAAWLFHNWKPLPVLTSGGPQPATSEPLSVLMRRLLEENGIPPSKIWTEEQSQSTYENALYSTRLLRQHGIHQIALVVDADSMLRAELCFRKQGLSVTPAPSFFWSTDLGWDEWIPGWKGIYHQETLAHESFGLLWYWLKGRI